MPTVPTVPTVPAVPVLPRLPAGAYFRSYFGLSRQPAVRFTQINNAVLIILSHLVPEHAGFDDSTSGGVTVASAADHLHENDVLGTAEELKSVREKVGAHRRAKQLE